MGSVAHPCLILCTALCNSGLVLEPDIIPITLGNRTREVISTQLKEFLIAIGVYSETNFSYLEALFL